MASFLFPNATTPAVAKPKPISSLFSISAPAAGVTNPNAGAIIQNALANAKPMTAEQKAKLAPTFAQTNQPDVKNASAISSTPPAITWNKDVATSVGQLLGIIPQGTVASGGYLDAKVAELRKTNPELAAEYDKVASGIQSGTMNPDMVMNYFIERESKNQPADYGSLAKAPYKTFTPYAEKAPEYKPFSLSDFIASPDYQFRLEQGQNAIDRAGSARGNFYSGGALKEAAKFGSDLASGEYNNARNNYVQDYGIKAGEYGDKYSRYNQDFSTGYGQATNDSNTLYNRYAGLAGAGSGVANAAVANNANNAAQAGNIYGQTANARAAAGIQGANNITQLLANSFGASSYGKPKYDPNTGARIS